MDNSKMASGDRGFKDFPELQKLSDSELQAIFLKGENLHIHESKASAAKRLLDIRAQQKHLNAIQNVEIATKQLIESNKELLAISEILKFFRKHFLPKQSILVKLFAFVGGTVILGIGLNLVATWIALYVFHWR